VARSRRRAAEKTQAASRAPSRRRQKTRYRIIEFKRNKDGVHAVVRVDRIRPQPHLRIALLHYLDGESVHLAPQGLGVGDVDSRSGFRNRPGKALPLRFTLRPVSANVELGPGGGGKMGPRSSGATRSS